MKLRQILAGVSALVVMSGTALAQDEDPALAMLDAINAELAAAGLNISVEKMELLGSGEGLAMGRTVIASDHGNKQLGSDWSPVDPNRGFRTNITHMIDTADVTADFPVGEQADVHRFGIETWDKQNCSNIGIDELPPVAADLGYVQWFFGFGGSFVTVLPGILGSVDVVHGGFLPPAFFDVLRPGGGAGILGVNFTFVWTGQDSDGNGRGDVAFKESYYNDGFNWVNDGTGERSDRNAAGERIFDIATVALHESGHALSRAHFGDVAIHHKKGLTTSPSAVMNAIYGGVKRELLGPDNGGHCSDWGAWPTQN